MQEIKNPNYAIIIINTNVTIWSSRSILQSQGKKRNKETNIYTGYIFISNVQSDYIYQKLFKWPSQAVKS